MDKNIEGLEIKAKIGTLKVTRNLALMAAALSPVGASVALTAMDGAFSSIVTLGASVATLGFNSYIVATSQREINEIKKEDNDKKLIKK